MNMENWDIDEIIRDFRQSENNEMKDSYRPEPEQPPEPKKPPEPEYLPEPENLPEPERVPEPERRVGSPKGKTHVFRSILVNGMYSVLCLLCVLWAFFNLHPTGISANTVIAPAVPRESAAPIAPEATPEPVPFTAPPAPTEAPEAVFAETQPTPEPVPEKIRYTIPEDAVSGPVPNPESWSFAQLDSPERVEEVIAQAREYGLLEENEIMAFDPGAEFYRGSYEKPISCYLDETILAILWKENIDGVCCTFAEVKIADASQLRRKLTDDSFGSQNNVFASVLAKEANAVVAMNADFYAFRDFGISVYNRGLYRFNTDSYTGQYQKYNCIDTLFINSKGDFLYKRRLEQDTVESIQQFIWDNDILFSIAFGPVLVENGEPIPCDWYPAGEVNEGYSRAGIGQMGERHYLYMAVSHGDTAARWTVTQFAKHFAEKPVITAYNLDGGQTGEVLAYPFYDDPYNHVDRGAERIVSDIIYFATAIPEGAAE